MRILICGDIVPTNSNIELFESADINTLIGTELDEYISNFDIKIANLECPIINSHDTPLYKCGPTLGSTTKSLEFLRKEHFDILSIANNHILDYGISGLKNTCKYLDVYGISACGTSLNDTLKGKIIEVQGLRIGVYSVVENEFTAVDDYEICINYYEPFNCFNDITQLREKVDYLIVLYHGGKEFYRYPSPKVQKTCRDIAKLGPDIIICQHSHCIGAREIYDSCEIIYGQGNFLFDHGNDEYWNSGLLVDIDLNRINSKVKYQAIVKNGRTIRLASKIEQESILEGFYVRSNDLRDNDKIQMLYDEFSSQQLYKYEASFLGRIGSNLILRGLNKLLKRRFFSLFFNKQNRIDLINYISCEAHREIIINALKRSL